MDEFEWAVNNLGIESPHELQDRGVNVFFAPNIDQECRVVNLADGRVNSFWSEEHLPLSGLYADYEGLMRYAEQRGMPFSETNGQVSFQPVGFDQAGDPLEHGEPAG